MPSTTTCARTTSPLEETPSTMPDVHTVLLPPAAEKAKTIDENKAKKIKCSILPCRILQTQKFPHSPSLPSLLSPLHPFTPSPPAPENQEKIYPSKGKRYRMVSRRCPVDRPPAKVPSGIGPPRQNRRGSPSPRRPATTLSGCVATALSRLVCYVLYVRV